VAEELWEEARRLERLPDPSEAGARCGAQPDIAQRSSCGDGYRLAAFIARLALVESGEPAQVVGGRAASSCKLDRPLDPLWWLPQQLRPPQPR